MVRFGQRVCTSTLVFVRLFVDLDIEKQLVEALAPAEERRSTTLAQDLFGAYLAQVAVEPSLRVGDGVRIWLGGLALGH